MALLAKDEGVMQDLKRLIRDYNRNEETHLKVYTRQDVVAYNARFATFFGAKCGHVLHTL
jgi:hypothetical protein